MLLAVDIERELFVSLTIDIKHFMFGENLCF